MFEDSLVESTHRVRTRAQRYVAGIFLVESAIVTTLILLPSLFPQALPRKFLILPVVTPPSSAAPAPAQPRQAAAARPTEFLGSSLLAPSRIPTRITPLADTAPPGPNIAGLDSARPGILGLPNLGSSTPPAVPDRPKSHDRIRVSEGVAAGQFIVPIRPVYPILALEARIQGTVTVDAVIGKDGRIASVHVLSGPPFLVPAAVEAIHRARYRPWILNGQPVEVETTIHIVFSLGDAGYTSRAISRAAPSLC
ncbi:MAG TPA: energy transducer TonB [Acidobacteriaceae bacterium]|jgi:protein TonB|nr:energy transducer TonB [Acidobacteriaceae bacterium]